MALSFGKNHRPPSAGLPKTGGPKDVADSTQHWRRDLSSANILSAVGVAEIKNRASPLV